MRNIPFTWPNGKRAAVSLTFDDGRKSQIEFGIPILNRYGIKATFYVIPSWVKSRLPEWREVVAAGHQIGNHTLHHPGTGNLSWAREKALEDYTLGQMANELDTADSVIERIFGVRPISFAYTCGQTFVGRGENVKSYVPLVAQRFLVGRGWRNECANDPSFCDLSHIMGIEFDGLNPEQLKALVGKTTEEGSWLVLCGHEIGNDGPQTTRVEALATFCEYASDPQNGLWVAPVADIASYIASQRPAYCRTRFVRSTHPILLTMLYAGVILIAGVLSFSYFLQTATQFSISSLVMLLGVVMLLFGLVWWKYYGYIHLKGLVGFWGVQYHGLRTWNSKFWHTGRTRKNKQAP